MFRQLRRCVYPLHTKGLATLLLLLTATSDRWAVEAAASEATCDAMGVCDPITPQKGGLSSLFHKRKKDPRCTEPRASCPADARPDVPRGGASADVVAAAADVYGIPLNGWKVLFQAMLTTMNVLCWYLPLKSDKIQQNPLLLSLANAFSGGVFLSLAFAHLIPESVHGYHGIVGNDQDVAPYLLVLGGYLLIFFVEKVAFDTEDILEDMEHENSGGGGGEKEASQPMVGKSAVILLGALAVHSILEMAALGLADTFADSAIMTLSIALHQPAESIALLIAFIKSGMPKDQIIRCLSIFSAMGPIGVALGMAVNEFASPIMDSIMVAVVAGTFVYVGATEIIPEEWEDGEHKWKKFGSLMLGMITILIITRYTAGLES